MLKGEIEVKPGGGQVTSADCFWLSVDGLFCIASILSARNFSAMPDDSIYSLAVVTLATSSEMNSLSAFESPFLFPFCVFSTVLKSKPETRGPLGDGSVTVTLAFTLPNAEVRPHRVPIRKMAIRPVPFQTRGILEDRSDFTNRDTISENRGLQISVISPSWITWIFVSGTNGDGRRKLRSCDGGKVCKQFNQICRFIT